MAGSGQRYRHDRHGLEPAAAGSGAQGAPLSAAAPAAPLSVSPLLFLSGLALLPNPAPPLSPQLPCTPPRSLRVVARSRQRRLLSYVLSAPQRVERHLQSSLWRQWMWAGIAFATGFYAGELDTLVPPATSRPSGILGAACCPAHNALPSPPPLPACRQCGVAILWRPGHQRRVCRRHHPAVL